jgi:hypothetical protein
MVINLPEEILTFLRASSHPPIYHEKRILHLPAFIHNASKVTISGSPFSDFLEKKEELAIF